MPNGTVKRLMDKGYGFIAHDGGDDLFFHFSDLEDGLEFDSLQEGDAVSFEMGQGQKGPKADSIARA